MFTLVIGGAASGKSAFAEELIVRSGLERRVYLATMQVWDKESERRVDRHRAMRAGKGFETVECFTDLAGVVKRGMRFGEEMRREGICVILECMSNLVANELYMKDGAGDKTVEAVMEGIALLKENCAGLVVVTNEVFSDLPPSKEMQEYCRMLGDVNCRMADEADEVTEVVYGIEVKIKG